MPFRTTNFLLLLVAFTLQVQANQEDLQTAHRDSERKSYKSSGLDRILETQINFDDKVIKNQISEKLGEKSGDIFTPCCWPVKFQIIETAYVLELATNGALIGFERASLSIAIDTTLQKMAENVTIFELTGEAIEIAKYGQIVDPLNVKHHCLTDKIT